MTKNRKERPSQNESRSFLFILISYLENTFHCFQHTFFLDRIKVGFYRFGQSWDIIQIFTPNKLGTKYTLCYFLSTTGCPQLLQQIHDFRSIVWYNFGAISTNTTFIIGNDSSQT